MTDTAKRKLSDIDFSKEGAHIALVTKTQGGPANKRDTALIMKAANFKPETLAKAQRVKVTMELPDFLRKFFNLYYDDSLVLASLLGYEFDDTGYDDEYYQEWVADKLENFEFIQKAHDADNLSDFVGDLKDTEYLKLLRTQAKIEKAFKKAEEGTGESSDDETGDTSKTNTDKTSDDNKEKKKMTTKDTVQKSVEELVQEAVEKARVSMQADLVKAQGDIAALTNKLGEYQTMEKEALQKAKQDTLAEYLEGETIETIMKATADMTDENFTSLVGVFKSLKSQVEQSSLFQESGVDADASQRVEKSSAAVANLLKSRFDPKA